MAVAWVGVFVIMGALAAAGVSNAVVYGVYPATVPLMAVGLAWAGIMAARAEWRPCGTAVAVAVVGVSVPGKSGRNPDNPVVLGERRS